MKKKMGIFKKVVFAMFLIVSLAVDVWFISSMIIRNSFAEMTVYFWEILIITVLTVVFCIIADISFKEKVRYTLSLVSAFSVVLFNILANARLAKLVLNNPSQEPLMLALQLIVFPYFISQILLVPIFITEILKILAKKSSIRL